MATDLGVTYYNIGNEFLHSEQVDRIIELIDEQGIMHTPAFDNKIAALVVDGQISEHELIEMLKYVYDSAIQAEPVKVPLTNLGGTDPRAYLEAVPAVLDDLIRPENGNGITRWMGQMLGYIDFNTKFTVPVYFVVDRNEDGFNNVLFFHTLN
jgi:hypothetical protein